MLATTRHFKFCLFILLPGGDQDAVEQRHVHQCVPPSRGQLQASFQQWSCLRPSGLHLTIHTLLEIR